MTFYGHCLYATSSESCSLSQTPVTGSEPFHFDPDKLGKIKPTLAPAEGYTLSVEDLRLIFGIDASYFGNLPKNFVVPVLEGCWHSENCYQVTGYLYVVKPEAWVPQVSHGETLPASAFKTTYVKQQETVTETKFNAGTSAQVNISAGGSFFGLSAELKASAEISFNHSTSTTTKETLETHGIQGDEPIHQLFIYPTLRCKVIKKQPIEYTIKNDSSRELKWTPDYDNRPYWEARRVKDRRVNEIRDLQIHPVPMKGNGLADKTYILPVPEVNASGELDVTTIISRQGWSDWFKYDAEWTTVNQKITLAAPHNDVAFRPMTTWTTIVS
ncbi:hypothetical protein QBC38DRAFT_515422 [Podospora fimiseda]|uniref:Uncharacterized protein n=1 Tax=Podospora fimiseda TaxID=252190 RepID=A0AAN7BJ52_9PEZI|nr:hypothetical protein QBC38DRAFT_515422 [Podospora fimiseda]